MARWSDTYHGWRDGLAAIPARSPALPASGPATTPHREALIRLAQDPFASEHLAYRTAVAQAHRDIMAEQARLAAAQDKLTWAQAAVELESRTLTREESSRRRLGEEAHPETVIIARRQRDQRRLIARAQAARKAAADERTMIQSQVDRLAEEAREHHKAAAIRVQRVHEHIHRRLAVYRRSLVRTHPEGAWVNAAMNTVAPEIPGWALPDAYLPDALKIPPSAAHQETLAEPPAEPEAVVEIITLREENRFGSELGRMGEETDRIACHVIADSAVVAPWHFTILKGTGQLHLTPRGYGYGPYIDGDQVTGGVPLRPGDCFDFADRRYTVQEGASQLHVARLGKSDLIAADLWAQSGDTRKRRRGDAKNRLSGMSFMQRERTVLAVLGPSGAGKTSTFSALLGELPLQSGKLYFRGLPMATQARQIREQLGFVPQQTELHMTLTVEETLRYGFGLRSPAGPAQREQAVNRALEQVKLEEQRSQVLKTLSGGQLRRVSIALELLTEPSLLMLDEPTSGLDAHMDRVVMTILREYAEKVDPQHPERSHTVCVVTHATEHLHLAHQILVVVKQGAPAYSGPPRQIRKHFGFKTYADLMSMLVEERDKWAAAYQAGKQCQEALTEARQVEEEIAASPGGQPSRWPSKVRHTSARARFQKFGVLIRRQVMLLRTRGLDKKDSGLGVRLKNLGAVTLPFTITAVLAALAATVTSSPGLGAQPGRAATTALTLLSTLAVLSGQALTYSDVVTEMPIIARESRAGVGAFPVLAAKWLVFAVIAIGQAAVITAVYCSWPHRAPQRALVTTPLVDLFLGLAALTVAAMSLGMLLSVLATKLEQAVTLVTGVSVLQIALNGLTSDLSRLSVSWVLAAPFPDRWGVAATASSVDLRGFDRTVVGADPLWAHSTHQWSVDIAVLGLLSALYFAFATWHLHTRLKPKG